MILYHYAKEPFPELTTRRVHEHFTKAQLDEEARAAEFRRDPAPYIDQISLFVEPVPLDIIGKLFSSVKHRIWVPGAVIWQHTVDTAKMGDFPFKFVETPNDIKFMDKNWPDGKDMTVADKRQYFEESRREKYANGEIGTGNKAFEKAARAFVGKTRAAYIKSTKGASKEDLERYATRVPHVMIYPIGGHIKLTKPATLVQIGENDYKEEKDSRFNFNGTYYDLNFFIRYAKDIPIKMVPVKDLAWILKGYSPTVARVKEANTDIPILISRVEEGLVTIDGFHRVAKAVKDGLKEIPAKYIPPSTLKLPGAKARIQADKEKALESLPPSANW